MAEEKNEAQRLTLDEICAMLSNASPGTFWTSTNYSSQATSYWEALGVVLLPKIARPHLPRLKFGC